MKFFSTFSQKYLEVIKKAVSLQRFREIEHIKLNEQMKGPIKMTEARKCLRMSLCLSPTAVRGKGRCGLRLRLMAARDVYKRQILYNLYDSKDS